MAKAVERGKGDALQEVWKRDPQRAGTLGKSGRVGMSTMHKYCSPADNYGHERGANTEASASAPQKGSSVIY